MKRAFRQRERFAGSGGSSLREFRKRRRETIKADWRTWTVLPLLAAGSAVAAWYLDGFLELVAAGLVGMFLTIMLVGWVIGGHVSALPWSWGHQGERFTGEEIEKLSDAWYCEHDIEHDHGNWDHVLVGPPGVFLLDSKLLHNPSTAANDALRAGRLIFRGGAVRSGAREVKSALGERFKPVPWVQAVIVVWGKFPQVRHEEQNVVYVHGTELAKWLNQLPERLSAPQRAAITEALRQVRKELASPNVERTE